MVSEELVRSLHDRATRGESLTSDEQALLEGWYALQDSAESSLLNSAAPEKGLASLQAQVDAALAQVAGVAKRIQELAAENEVLRREIATLRRELAARTVPQPT